MQQYPKRLIEVDLPIKRISAHARREKSIRHGHISTLHIWWARRPLAACRAVICASLWPDPADPNCPQAFRDAAHKHVLAFAKATQSDTKLSEICDDGSWKRYMRLANGHGLDIDPINLKGQTKLRAYLLDFIADFAAWEASTHPWFLDTARSLTQAAHEALGGEKGTRPLVVDPFAGGGAIPLEALRVGADAFASDLNPVAVLLNKVVLEYVPKYGQRLADEVRKWGQWVKDQAEKELTEFYPEDPDGATPVAYLWARTMKCQGPDCGVNIPLMNTFVIANKRTPKVIVRTTYGTGLDATFVVEETRNTTGLAEGTVRQGSVTCPQCGFTLKADGYRAYAKSRGLGQQMVAVVTQRAGEAGKSYRSVQPRDLRAWQAAKQRLGQLAVIDAPDLSTVPTEKMTWDEPRRLNVLHYGLDDWGKLFGERQQLALIVFGKALQGARETMRKGTADHQLCLATTTVLGLAISHIAQYNSNVSSWLSDGLVSAFIQSSSIPMRSDYAEVNPLNVGFVGGFSYQLDKLADMFEKQIPGLTGAGSGSAENRSATESALPDESVDAVVTDPPYYFAIPYADLSDFFYVWLRRLLGTVHPNLFTTDVTPKLEEAVQSLPHSKSTSKKDRAHFERQIERALSVAKRSVKAHGLAVVVFAHAATEAWESLLSALLAAEWTVTGSWPIDTERGARMLASRQRTLSSSVHLACRPRRSGGASIGDWRDVLDELPKRIREWMARLSNEGVVGADAIFACLGPALEIFSRYSRVEKASGEPVLLQEYLTYVWGAVAQEALAQIFEGADAAGFEEDARLTAMWLWTLNAGAPSASLIEDTRGETESADASEELDGEDEASASKSKASGYALEFDAARKIAQGLGAHLEQLTGVIEVKGDKARLLSVGERTKRLFGKEEADAPQQAKRKKKDKQMKLFSPEDLGELEAEEGGWGDKSAPKLGDTALDRVHQSMILFAAGRGEALRRFLVEDGAGQDQRFWKLANALSALYPQGTDEKRWVDGVLARKKGLGL